MTIEQAELIDEALSFLLDQSYEREDDFEEQVEAAKNAAYAAVSKDAEEAEDNEAD
jgi:hypothetical protein